MPTTAWTNAPETELAGVLAQGGVRSLYQPIVDLATGSVIGVEALARGPEGPFHLPGALFAAARVHHLEAALDAACRVAALRGALDVGLPDGVALFVNVESAHLGAPPTDELIEAETAAAGRLHVVLELTERDLVRDPAAVLRAVAGAREAGWGIALDDVGVEPGSLALMPLVRPDVVKLDMGLVQGEPTAAIGRVVSAVCSYAEESGALVLAEGIETGEQLERAVALGATLGQGWRWSRAAPLEDLELGTPNLVVPHLGDSWAGVPDTPFDLVTPERSRTARKSQMLGLSRHLERQALEQPTPPLLFAAFEEAPHFTADTARRYEGYARACPLVAALGVGLPIEPVVGVRGAALDDAEALADQWVVVLLSPHFAGALIARDLGDGGPDRDRRFEFALTHDRELVTAAARSLARRIATG
jgi:EAL domain-containing protein (putative c-di-GMP-specific phosphodiesterase class I)